MTHNVQLIKDHIGTLKDHDAKRGELSPMFPAIHFEVCVHRSPSGHLPLIVH